MKTMKNIIRCILFFFGLLAGSCNVTDGTKDCEVYVRFVYDYNMAYVDLFPQQATIMDLFLFDEEDMFLTEVKDHSGSFPEDYLMRLPIDGYRKTYDLVAWSGLYEEAYEYVTESSRSATVHSLGVKSAASEGKVIDYRLPALWHGRIMEEAGGQSHEVKTIRLMKDTNTFRFVIKNNAGMNTYAVEDLDVRILSANSRYDYDNRILDEEGDHTVYLPYYTEDDPEAGSVFEMNTLRLMEDRDTRLVITHKASGEKLELSLNTYLNALRLQQYGGMELQEYLDREDTFLMVIFLGMPEFGYLTAEVTINGWYVRIQDEDQM